jgi:hypothetical protein
MSISSVQPCAIFTSLRDEPRAGPWPARRPCFGLTIGNLRQRFPRWRSLLAISLALLLIGALSACKPAAQAPPGPPPPMNVGITGYNFTNEGVQEYYVDGSRGSNLPPLGGGGKTSCCVSLPDRWTPHLKVTVDWTIGHYTEPWEKRKHMTVAEESDCCWTQRTLSKTVPVERYGEKGGRLQVFFLPDDEVQVWVYDAGPQNPEHPSGRGYPRNTNPEK